MDPNTNDTNQPPQPPTIVGQPSSESIQVQPQPVTTTAMPPQPTTLPSSPVSTSSSHKGLIVGITVAAIILIVGGLLAGWLLLWSPQAQAKHLSSSFMSAITSGDVDQAVKVSGDSSNKDFLQSASSKVHGAYAMTDSTYKDGKGYYLYSLSGAQTNYARTSVAKQDGKLQITSFVYDTSQLKLIPDSTSMKAPTPSKIAPKPTAKAVNCLVPADYGVLTGGTNTIVHTATTPYIGNVHFLSDSLSYSDSTQPDLLEPFGDFYKSNPAKDYVFHLYGSVATSASSDKTFANQRAQKVESDLEALGVPATKIMIDTPQNVDDQGGASSATAAQTARVVVISIVPGCSPDSTTSPTGR
ncbi:MAG: hypothetical protein ABI220_05435 [Candidatus Saccharimonadales bacterium]